MVVDEFLGLLHRARRPLRLLVLTFRVRELPSLVGTRRGCNGYSTTSGKSLTRAASRASRVAERSRMLSACRPASARRLPRLVKGMGRPCEHRGGRVVDQERFISGDRARQARSASASRPDPLYTRARSFSMQASCLRKLGFPGPPPRAARGGRDCVGGWSRPPPALRSIRKASQGARGSGARVWRWVWSPGAGPPRLGDREDRAGRARPRGAGPVHGLAAEINEA